MAPEIFLLVCLVSGLEVFLVPHCHTDAGWLEDPEYYYNMKVRGILTTVTELLRGDRGRKFVWGEIYYFRRWFQEIESQHQADIRNFVSSGQLEFVGSGLVQHDEALPSLDMMVRQMEEGFDFLNAEFGISKLDVAWQIDPFGHSGLSPELFLAMGYRYFVGNRIDQTLRDSLKEESHLEFLWHGSDLGQNRPILTHILPNSYGFPRVLDPRNFGASCWARMRRNPGACESEVLKWIEESEKYFPHGKLMLLYGDDFAFAEMSRTVDVMNKLEGIFKALRDKKGINIHWSTASDYFRAIQSSAKFPSFYGDFFPYVCTKKTPFLKYWTGFYSLLPNFKRRIFEVNELVRFADILTPLVSQERKTLATGLNLCMHHDAITATSRPKVIDYYRKGLEAASESALEAISAAAEVMLEPGADGEEMPAHRPIVLYNALNWPRDDLFHFESECQFIAIHDPRGSPVAAQVFQPEKSEKYTVYFRAKLPPVSLNLFSVFEHSSLCDECAALTEEFPKKRTILSDDFTVAFSDSGFVTSVEMDGERLQWQESFVVFSGNSSGAYIFFPQEDAREIQHELLSFRILDGPLFTAADVVWKRAKSKVSDKYDSQLVLLAKGLNWIHWEVRTFAEPNEEVMVRIDTPPAKDYIPLYTYDSVSWRRRVFRKPQLVTEVGMNFYPVSGAALLGSKDSGVLFIPFHPLGVGTVDGKYLLHLQRSLKKDDDFGLVHHIEDSSVSLHTFRLASPKRSLSSFQHLYYEGKQSNRLFAVAEEFRLALTPVMDSPIRYKKTTKVTSVWMGFYSRDLYLSSVTLRGKAVVARFLNLASDSVDIAWPNITIGEKLYATKYGRWKRAVELKGNADEICAFDCENGRVVELFEVQHDGKAGRMVGAREFATFSVATTGLVYEQLTSEWTDEERSPCAFLEPPTDTQSEFLEVSKEPSLPPEPESPPVEVLLTTIEDSTEEPAELPQSEQEEGEEEMKISGHISFLASSEAITRLEYAVVASLSLISLCGIVLFFRSKKQRSE